LIFSAVQEGNHRVSIGWRNIRLGFRMLQLHELAAAQSFPKDYKFTGTKTEVVKQIGNAVCPMMAKALVEAGGME
jgi:site-specific DNA-cytosine methylase